MQLNLTDETVEILLQVGARMRLPELPLTETLELVIEHLADSVDSQMELATTKVGEPVAMEAAINAILSPDISTAFSMPDEQPDPSPKVELTFEQILERGGNHGKGIDDAIPRRAVTIVYNQLDKEMWNTPEADRLVSQTIGMLQKQISQHE